MKGVVKALLPMVILIAAAGLAWQIYVHSPKVQPKTVAVTPPAVKVVTVRSRSVQIPIFSQGTVAPRTEVALAAEVMGRVVVVSPKFAEGGFFKKGELLLQIDPKEYELAIIKAKAQVTQAKEQLTQADALFKQKLREYAGVDPAQVTDFGLRKPQFENAMAQLEAAEADLQLAQLRLERTRVIAPFDGRIGEKHVDIGQYVAPGGALAQLDAVDVAEIRLPITAEQAGIIDLPPITQTRQPNRDADVIFYGQYASRKQTWQGHIVRTDARLDEQNRLLYLVAQVVDPYGLRHRAPRQTPLPMGLFVRAEIQGQKVNHIVVLPRAAVHDQDGVLLLDGEQRLRKRRVDILYRGKERVYIQAGLADGDQVIVSPLDTVIDGMQLRIVSD